LVAEVNARLQQLFHRNRCQKPSFFVNSGNRNKAYRRCSTYPILTFPEPLLIV
jgi:hypothetical protein